METDTIDRLAQDEFPHAEVAEADELDQLMFDPPRCCGTLPCSNPEECPR